jgi:1-acyl-sn-glycerol-3-phosphate acyltransferase
MRRAISRRLLELTGWEPEGALPRAPKWVLIAAPHTSNWDLVYLLALADAFDARISFMMKHSMFRGPLGPIFRSAGGIAIRRDRRNDLVKQMVEEFARRDRFALVVPAEATRARVEYWKSGFYHIAREAGVPIVMGYLDFARRRGGFGPAFHPTGDVRADMDRIRAFYADKTGKHPELFAPPRLREEDVPSAIAAR